jgi:hypothetical protein
VYNNQEEQMSYKEELLFQLRATLEKAWSIESSSKWSLHNPAKGQCGVTALVVQDILQGEIMKTQTPEGWHFYNFIDGKRVDFTESQFSQPISYMDVESSRKEALMDTNMSQYSYLKESVSTFQC